MASTIPQKASLVKSVMEIMREHRPLLRQERVYWRMLGLFLAEVMTFGQHQVTQLLWTLGLNADDWTAWYQMFRKKRFDVTKTRSVLLEKTLEHVKEEALYVVAGDGTQTPRTSGKIEGVGFLPNMRTPVFRRGIHWAQRWFNGSWMVPAEEGYSRAVPLYWEACFTEKAHRTEHEPRKEWEVALQFLDWLGEQFKRLKREGQRILMLVDGSYDTLEFWKQVPKQVVVLARSAKNRALCQLPTPQKGKGRKRKYGDAARSPQQYWQKRDGWKKIDLNIRGCKRRLRYRVEGPFLRRGAPDTPLFLLIIGGETYNKHGRRKHREPVPYLVNAVQDEFGHWQLPLPVETLIFWAWQRWEIEVCHRELKTNFGMGDKQCWHPQSAVLSVQWSAWLYSVLLLAGYQTWGLCHAPSVPTTWWRGSRRWSFATLIREFRAELWHLTDFRDLWALSGSNWGKKEALISSFDYLFTYHPTA